MTARKQHRPAFIYRLLRLIFRWLGPLFPSLSARLAANLWRRTKRFPSPKREQVWCQSPNGEQHLKVGEAVIFIQSWGEGPVVLLIHGWNGRGSQMGGFIAPLIEQGFRVVTFDAPGHGRSDGRDSSLVDYLAAIQTIQQQYGPFFAMIGHSFGAMAIQVALQRGVTAQCCVLISGPDSVPWLAERFLSYIQLPQRVVKRFNLLFEQRYGEDSWSLLSPVTHTKSQSCAALFIHDRDDRDVPWLQSRDLAEQWSGAELLITEALGHRRVLRSPLVIEAVQAFLIKQRQQLS